MSDYEIILNMFFRKQEHFTVLKVEEMNSPPAKILNTTHI